jgi:hypothetical protein
VFGLTPRYPKFESLKEKKNRLPLDLDKRGVIQTLHFSNKIFYGTSDKNTIFIDYSIRSTIFHTNFSAGKNHTKTSKTNFNFMSK